MVVSPPTGGAASFVLTPFSGADTAHPMRATMTARSVMRGEAP